MSICQKSSFFSEGFLCFGFHSFRQIDLVWSVVASTFSKFGNEVHSTYSRLFSSHRCFLSWMPQNISMALAKFDWHSIKTGVSFLLLCTFVQFYHLRWSHWLHCHWKSSNFANRRCVSTASSDIHLVKISHVWSQLVFFSFFSFF